MATMDEFKKKWFLLIISIILIAGFSFWYIQNSTEERISSQDIPIKIEVEKVQFLQGGKGEKFWKVVAEKCSYLKEESSIELSQPKFTFYFSDQNEIIQVQSPQGQYDRQKGTARLWPKVNAQYGEASLRADQMKYKDDSKQLLFQNNIRIERPNLQLRSQKAICDLRKNELIAIGNVEVIINGQFNLSK